MTENQSIAAALRLLIGFIEQMTREARAAARKSGFNPNEPRVPAGNPGVGGRWTREGGWRNDGDFLDAVNAVLGIRPARAGERPRDLFDGLGIKPEDLAPERGPLPQMNVDNALRSLRAQAIPPFGEGSCAKHVRAAIDSALGIRITPPHDKDGNPYAKLYTAVLPKLGLKKYRAQVMELDIHHPGHTDMNLSAVMSWSFRLFRGIPQDI